MNILAVYNLCIRQQIKFTLSDVVKLNISVYIYGVNKNEHVCIYTYTNWMGIFQLDSNILY